MNVLGLNAYHADAAAALVRDGVVVAAVEEERFSRIKHWAGLPVQAAAWCLEAGGSCLSDVDVLAVNRNPRANLLRKVGHTLWHRPDPSLLVNRLRNLGRVTSVVDAMERDLPGGAPFHGVVRQIEHHLAHHASSFLASPFGDAVLLSVDGFGDFTSTSWGWGSGKEIRLNGRVYFPHSLGVFYLTMTQYLGFLRYGDEYRVMGLAPYGEIRYLEEMRRVVRGMDDDGTFRLDLRYFRHHNRDLRYRWEGGLPTVESHFTPDLERLLGPARAAGEDLTDRHRDVACSVQARFEECVLALLRKVHDLHPMDTLCLSGGGAMNSVTNGKVIRETPFRNVYIPSAPGDAGGAIGAALQAWVEATGERPPPVLHAYHGPGFGRAATENALALRAGDLQNQACTIEWLDDPQTLCSAVADQIAEGRVVGWFQDRMEFGPRALGHRSILCDPRREEMRAIINARIKLREPFRPFAPSVLREAMCDWFEVDDDVPFMMKVHPIRESQRSRVPAVTHVDGTGRPHTVTREQNPLYYRLITAFRERTGVPMVLNTSFNENEPIVHRPEEAVDCFLRTEMDVLVLGACVLRKAQAGAN